MTPEMLATLTEQVAELVQTYSNNYLQFQRATYNETQVRVDFVNVGIGCDGEDTINRVLKYFGLTANPQAPAEETKKGVCVSLEDFL